jgi:hypothetical protein
VERGVYILGLKGRGNREWRRLQNEELYDLYSSSDINRVIKNETVGVYNTCGERCGTYRVLVGKSEGKAYCVNIS